ncbi:hypothetical protein ABTK65_20035, partial [Acinetobacter baumannii]
ETAARLNALLSEDNRAQLNRALAQLEQAAGDTSRLMAALQPGARELPGLLKDADAATLRADAALRRIEALAADGQQLAQELKSRAAMLD